MVGQQVSYAVEESGSVAEYASHILLAMGSGTSGDPVDDLIDWIFAPPFAFPQRSAPRRVSGLPESISYSIRDALKQIHIHSSARPVRFPNLAGAFPPDLLAVVPPVVPDANTLRDDILYSADHDVRTVQVNAANSGLFRLFCAQHVADEVCEHSGDWTQGKRVSQLSFMKRWVSGYLPVIRVLPDHAIPDELLTPAETVRLDELKARNSKDIPSVKLVMVLGAVYNTHDGPALRAAHGAGVDVAAHDEWRDILKAGGDAGQLSAMTQVAYGLAGGLTVAGFQGARSLLRFTGPLGFAAIGAGLYFAYKKIGPETKAKISTGAAATLDMFAEAYGEYCKVRERFEQATARVPSWDELATVLTPEAVLARACMHTLARAGAGNCSARELRPLLPVLPVPSGEAKVRRVLRSFPGCFAEVYAGHWQVGTVARPVQQLLTVRPDLAEE